MSLPSDTVIHDIKLKVNLVGTSEALASSDAHMYAIEGWILPVLDPDSIDQYDAIWNALVPKDTDVTTMDLDTGTSDSTPFYEPGEADWSALMDVGLRPERLYHRHAIRHIGNASSFTFQDNQTPFAVKWIANDIVRVHIRRRLRVRQPSCLVFALATPALDDTTASSQSILIENEWASVKYASQMLERAMMSLFGIVEAGAETPWDEAVALLQKHLDPDVFEETATAWGTAQYNAFSEMVVDHSVVGTFGKIPVTTGR